VARPGLPEDNANREVASDLVERPATAEPPRHIEIAEIVEAVVLAVVAVATAFSGFQAAKWDAASSRDYASSTHLRVFAEEAQLASNQKLNYDSDLLGDWLLLTSLGDAKKASLLTRRFTTPYAVAFHAWLKTDPLHDPRAPKGPEDMPQFKDPLAARAVILDAHADAVYETAVSDRETSDRFVRLTVILAGVLFLIAIGQRFSIRRVRVAVLVVAGVFLTYALVLLFTYPWV